MSDYTDGTKVGSMFRDLDTASANAAVSDAEILVFIAEAEAEINTKLNRYYTVPILIGVAPVSNLVMSKIATFKVAHVVRGILDSLGQVSEDEKAIDYDKAAEKLLNDCLPTKAKDGSIVDAKVDLYDATKKAIGPQNDSLFRASKDAGDSGPTFQKGVDSW